MRQAGSIPCTGIDPKRLDRWMEVGKRLLPSTVHVGKNANNRLVVTSEDVGITCGLLEFVGKHMNKDGTLPWARTKGLWDCLLRKGSHQPVVQCQEVCLDSPDAQRCGSGGYPGPDLRHRRTGGEMVAVREVLGDR